MKNHIRLIAAIILLASTVCLAVESSLKPTTQRAKVRIVLAGDSTVTNHAGWGVGFARQLQGDIEVINLSVGGRSSKSFRAEGRWKQCLELKPDYILIQFGHNDIPGKGPERETDPKTNYTQFMTQYVEEARAAGVKPILVASVERRDWQGDKFVATLADYADAVRRIAEDKKVPLIDLNAKSLELYNKLGVDGCNKISPADKTDKTKFDNTHFNAGGSEVIGKIVADELRTIEPELGAYIK